MLNKIKVLSALVLLTSMALAKSEQDLDLQNQQNIPKSPNVRIGTTEAKDTPKLPVEAQCFDINSIELQGANGFGFALQSAINKLSLNEKVNSADAIGVCLGEKSIISIANEVQNSIIQSGYTTTKALLKEQNLKSKKLIISVIPGYVHNIRVESNPPLKAHEQDALLFSSMPLKSGDVLNIRAIEQALENLKRVPNHDASFEIVPASKELHSDIVIKWQKSKFPFRLGFSIDDSGSKSTGKYQGGTTLSSDNLLGLNDTFYLSYTRDIAGYDKVNDTDSNGAVIGTQQGKSNNMALHYSFPIGYNLISLNHSKYHYDQAVAGANQIYRYIGYSNSDDISLGRVVYRSDKAKTTLSVKLQKKSGQNYIDDAHITVQDRATTTMEYGIAHKQFMGSATADLALKYRAGIGAFDPLNAPEDKFGEGASRPKIWTGDIAFSQPFTIKDKNLNFTSTVHGQYTNMPLIPQDRISIGSRYTVRGFDGDYSLSSNKGFYIQNELSFEYIPSHKLYIGVDGGKVYGKNIKDLIGQSLVGGVFGIRGNFGGFGNLSYDAFIGTPLYKPELYPTAHETLGFNINYSF